MSKPKRARQVRAGRLYEWRKPGTPLTDPFEKYWSVTTILSGAIPKPALLPWGIKTVAEYAVANHKQLSALLDAVRIKKDGGNILVVSDPDAVQGAINWLKESPYRERDRKADMGTSIHEHAEAYQKRKPFPPATGEIAPYLEQFHRFLDEWGPKYELAEASVYNRTLKYAGTLDAIATVPGLGKILLDYKTGGGVYPESALQLSAYRFAEFVGMPDGKEAPMLETEGAAVVWLQPDRYELIPVAADERTFTSFRHAIEIFRWAEEISKTVIWDAVVPAKEEQDATH